MTKPVRWLPAATESRHLLILREWTRKGSMRRSGSGIGMRGRFSWKS